MISKPEQYFRQHVCWKLFLLQLLTSPWFQTQPSASHTHLHNPVLSSPYMHDLYCVLLLSIIWQSVQTIHSLHSSHSSPPHPPATAPLRFVWDPYRPVGSSKSYTSQWDHSSDPSVFTCSYICLYRVCQKASLSSASTEAIWHIQSNPCFVWELNIRLIFCKTPPTNWFVQSCILATVISFHPTRFWSQGSFIWLCTTFNLYFYTPKVISSGGQTQKYNWVRCGAYVLCI